MAKVEIPTILSQDEKFRYQLLDRLKQDCRYYLGNGNRNKKNLWAGDEKEQIEVMKQIRGSFSTVDKPEWLTEKEILEYEKQMIK